MFRLRGVAGLARRALLAAVTVSALAALPASALADATPGPAPVAGAPGLPDGRVYEQVSPANKFGNEAGGPTSGTPPYVVAGIEGNEVAFSKSGPFGETPTGFEFFTIARRSPAGWQNRGALPRGEGFQGAFVTNPEWGLGFSAGLTSTVFGANGVFVPEQSPASPTPHLYRYDEDGTVQWIGKPMIAQPLRYEGFDGKNFGGSVGKPAGASPNYSTIYFAYQGVLTPAEEVPNPTLGGASRAEVMTALNAEASPPVSDAGFYAWRDGQLEYAGVLPDGYVDPRGAVPASTLSDTGYSSEDLANQVSADGQTAFFVSPDPNSDSGRPAELYAREIPSEGSPRSVLVSRDLLLPTSGGEPAAAPDGVVLSVARRSGIYASPDGSHVLFESVDSLTADAPNTPTPKEYSFDTITEKLSYLPEVGDVNAAITISASSQDASDFLFVREGELALWNKGQVTTIGPVDNGNASIPVARATASGSVFVFQTSAPFPALGFNNGGGAYEQIYRYDVATNELTCLSCTPPGVPAAGNAALANALPSGNHGNTSIAITGSRGISEDGSRVFFDTPTPLVVQATDGVRNVYEWENGTVSLISTGVSAAASYFGDNSPSGDDVFFGTEEGLASGDTDEAYDVYDARVPRPGDRLPPSAPPCEGSVCQGPPSVPNLLGSPASEAFSGPGNQAPQMRRAAKSKRTKHKQKHTRKRKHAKRKHAKRKHADQKAHRHGKPHRRGRQNSTSDRHGNRRGK